jgi:signal transduction histidine kinase
MGQTRWLQPTPRPAATDARRSAVLRTLLLTLVGADLLAVGAVPWTNRPAHAIACITLFLVIEANGLILLRLGRVAASAWSTVLLLWGALTGVTAFYGGLAGEVPITFTVVLAVGALALPWHGALVTTGLCLLSVVGLAVLDLRLGRPSPAQAIMAIGPTLVGVGVMATTAVHALDAALERAHQRGVELSDALDRLARSNVYRIGVLNALGEPVLVTDEDGRVRYANPSAFDLLKTEPELLYGRPLAEVVEVAGAPLEPQEVVRRGALLGVDATLEASPEPIPVRLSVTALTREDGAPALVCSATDARLPRRAMEELQRALRLAEDASSAKSRFLANMSHELRTPLNAIIGYAEMLLEEGRDQADDLARIRDSGRHLLALISDVLDLSKIEAGKMALIHADVALEPLVGEVVRTLEPAVALNANELVLDLAPDLGRTWVDPLRLRQVLQNLLSNAAKFTRDGTIVVRATREPGERGERLVFEVRDTGIGMTAAQLARVFEPFTQADESTSRRYGGTGLGLALSSRFAEMLGGTLTLDSELGVGTTARLVVPAVEPEVPAQIPLQLGVG